MHVLILQLSDIHIRTGSDPILGRAAKIVDAVRDLDHRVDLCILALTGDVAFAGREDQYGWAGRWLGEIRNRMRDAFRGEVPVEVIAIAGNHDCDLANPSPARTSLIEAMIKDPRIATDPSTATTCVQPQRAFIEFRDRHAAAGLVFDGLLYYEYRFGVGDETILIRCLNTSWVSQNPENPSKLTFPVEVVPAVPVADGSTRDVVVISTMHHTYNWLAPNNIRALRRRLQSVSEFILTGHEHEFGMIAQRDHYGGGAIYIEGLALQAHGAPPTSGFNAVVIDTAEQRYQVLPFAWTGTRYEEAAEAPCRSWTAFTANPLRAGHVFAVSNEMRARLEDPGITLRHPSRGKLELNEIFVYPDLREVAREPKPGVQSKTVSGRQLLELSNETGRLLVTGSDESGKTCLAKRLFVDALDEGLVPVLIDGRSARLKGSEKDRRELGRLFEEQYDATAADFLDLPREQRVILVDDASALGKGGSQTAVLDYLIHFAGRVVLFADEVAQLVQEIAGLAPLAAGREPFVHYGLLPMGHVRREELIDRYVGLAGNGDPGHAAQLRVDMRRILAAAVGKYFAPPTPITVVSILQARAFNDQLNLQQSTYGYYYELLIKRQLLGEQPSVPEMDVQLAYLSELAYAAFCAGESRWSEGWFMDFHKRFVADRRVPLEFVNTSRVLVERGILSCHQADYEFRYPYIRYYFTASAIARRLTTQEGRDHIVRLTRRLHEQESANILLFLTHYSKDAAILDPMLEQADSLFADAARADLSPEPEMFVGLDEALRVAVFVDRPTPELRRQYLERLDDLAEVAEQDVGAARTMPERTAVIRRDEPEEARREEREAAVQEVLGLLSRIYISFRTMQILGQLLKNFPGSLNDDQKERITRAVYGVALRTLGHLHALFREHTDELAAQVVEALRLEHPDLENDELLAAAHKTVSWQLYRSALGIIQRTAMDVGTPLLKPIFEDVEQADPVPAIRLITLALKLDRARKFPEQATRTVHEELGKNPLAHRVLMGLVMTHFHLFDVPHATKQSICALLGIDYRPMLPKSKTRMVGPAR